MNFAPRWPPVRLTRSANELPPGRTRARPACRDAESCNLEDPRGRVTITLLPLGRLCRRAGWRVTCTRWLMLVHVVLVLIVAGVALWLIETFVPMDAKVLRLLQAVVIIVLIVWLLRVFGIINLWPAARF